MHQHIYSPLETMQNLQMKNLGSQQSTVIKGLLMDLELEIRSITDLVSKSISTKSTLRFLQRKKTITKTT